MRSRRRITFRELGTGLVLAPLLVSWLSSCKLLGDHDTGSPASESIGGAPNHPDAIPPNQPEAGAPWARYVFLFIGDGMGAAQVQATAAYLANQTEHDDIGGSTKVVPLAMRSLPVLGMQQTSSWNTLITDSAAAGTAISTGHKTAWGVLAMDPTATVNLPTIAEVAKQSGMKVGIVSSVSLDHATPASFYAHEPSRNNYHFIGHALVDSGFDYFGGGGLLDPDGTALGELARGNVIAAAEGAGYVVTDTRAEFESLVPGTRAVAIGPRLDDRTALSYSIDRANETDPSEHITLAEFTQKGIELLHDASDSGFFMMVEGGKIDWACEANDARTAIAEVIALDESVAVALAFMAEHPQETLIVVTGDHETGGMSLGSTTTGYDSHLEHLEPQKISFSAFDRRIADVLNAGNPPENMVETTLDEDLLAYFGIDYSTLSAFERLRIDEAYAKVMFGTSPNQPEEDRLRYSGKNPLSTAITRVIATRSGIGWASFFHTGSPVPVMAGGANASLFSGYYDNTEISRKLAAAMRIRLPE